jgi:hypothetical protein
MPQLQSISTFPAEAVDLLEAVGYISAKELCQAHDRELLNELVKANKVLGIMSEMPTAEVLKSWKALAAAEVADFDLAPADESVVESPQTSDSSQSFESVDGQIEQQGESPAATSVNFEQDPEVLLMLATSPEAELIPLDLIKKNHIAVGDIAEGILLSECHGDVEMKVLTAQDKIRQERHADKVRRSGLMTSRIRSFTEAENGDHHVKPLDRGQAPGVVSISEGLNAGVSPNSRRFVRGVLHPSPWRVRVAAFFAVLAQCFLALTFIAVPSLMIYDYWNDAPEVLWWIVGILVGLVVSGICYLIWGIRAQCRVCGQRQFAPKMCLKNRKAHHIPVIGYIFPTALHAMFYKWFYCTYCGTAVRLKK